jgi:hypothetical protein
LIRQPQIGETFGEWTVVARLPMQRRWRCSVFTCRCSCGRVYTVARGRLMNGTSTRCQICGRSAAGKTRTLPRGTAQFNALLRLYKERAIERGFLWELPDYFVRALIVQRCYYCGAEPSNTWQRILRYNGIDRFENNLGYTLGNSVACCGTCNRWKSDMRPEKFIEHARQISGQTH